jgi:hypothetical protein
VQFCKFIRVAAIVTGLSMVPSFAQPGNTASNGPSVELDEGGRRVALKPIDEVGFGGYSQSGWPLAAGLAGVALLGSLGALLTSKLLK